VLLALEAARLQGVPTGHLEHLQRPQVPCVRAEQGPECMGSSSLDMGGVEPEHDVATSVSSIGEVHTLASEAHVSLRSASTGT
jgi:hypothetical protein